MYSPACPQSREYSFDQVCPPSFDQRSIINGPRATMPLGLVFRTAIPPATVKKKPHEVNPVVLIIVSTPGYAALKATETG